MTVAYNTVSQLIGRGLSGGATFLISIILAHAYGARGFGDFTIITTFVAVFYLFADFGLNAVFLQDDLKQSAAWQTLIAARILISIVSIVLALSILSFLPVGIDRGYTSVIKLGIILYCPTIFLQALINSANAVFQQKFRYDLSTLAVVAGSLVSLGLVWLTTQLFLPGVAVSAAVVAMEAGLLVTAMLAAYLAGKYNSWIFVYDWPKVRSFLIRSLPLGLTLVFNVIYFRADSFILTLPARWRKSDYTDLLINCLNLCW